MGCCPSQDDKKEPLIPDKSNPDDTITKATGSAVSVESTQIKKNITPAKADIDSKEKEQQTDAVSTQNNIIPINPTDEKDSKENEPPVYTQKTDVMPGQILIEQTFDLQQDLNVLKEKYKENYKPLLKRDMISLAKDNVEVTQKNSIKIMQFNMLADGLSTAYRWVAYEKTFLKVDPICLQWTYRGLRLVEEILRFEPDVIAIEECDQLDFLMKYLAPVGYNSYFQEKTISAIRHVIEEICDERKLETDSVNIPFDGLACIYKTDKFEMCDEKEIQYIDMTQNKEKVPGLVVPLKWKNMDKDILFVVTHLKSTKSEKGEQWRERQINLLLKELIKNDKSLPVVLCCDLNANPVKNKKGYDPLCYNAITNQENLGFESVYKLAKGNEPEYTTFKLREHGTDKHVLDYIFVKDGNWEVTGILNIPESSDEADAMIPNWHYPSDHFSILAQLTWK